jgi:hypothetical protein
MSSSPEASVEHCAAPVVLIPVANPSAVVHCVVEERLLAVVAVVALPAVVALVAVAAFPVMLMPYVPALRAFAVMVPPLGLSDPPAPTVRALVFAPAVTALKSMLETGGPSGPCAPTCASRPHAAGLLLGTLPTLPAIKLM